MQEILGTLHNFEKTNLVKCSELLGQPLYLCEIIRVVAPFIAEHLSSLQVIYVPVALGPTSAKQHNKEFTVVHVGVVNGT